jgi:hypothetical protein
MVAIVTGAALVVLVLALAVIRVVRPRRDARRAPAVDIGARRAETDVRTGHVGGGWTSGL